MHSQAFVLCSRSHSFEWERAVQSGGWHKGGSRVMPIKIFNFFIHQVAALVSYVNANNPAFKQHKKPCWWSVVCLLLIVRSSQQNSYAILSVGVTDEYSFKHIMC